MDESDKLGGEGTLEERFDRLTDDEGKPIMDKALRETRETVPKKETGRQKRYRRRLERQKKKEEALKNINEYWYKDPNIAVKVPDSNYEELTRSLIENREKLEELKRYYCRSRRRQHPIITEAYLQEIKRHVLAIEAIKDILASKANEYRVYYTDREHPLEACERIILDCFVASCIYGREAPETNLLRIYRDVRLSKNPFGRILIKSYYAFAGPLLSRIIARSRFLQRITRRILDRFMMYISKSL